MLNQLQLFYTYKFNSDRLKQYNYNIKITIEESRKNGELVSIGDNHVLRTIRQLTNSKYEPDVLKYLETEKKYLQKQPSTPDTIKLLKDIRKQIDNMLHIPEYISVIIDNKSQYKQIIKKGIIINGTKYVRLLCGAGHARKNMVMFCAEHIEKELKEILKNGMMNIEMAHPKYNAYFALSSSSTYKVSNPRVCVVPDCIIKRKELVDWVEEFSVDDTVEEKEVELEFNLWDGMGIISPELSEKWSKELGIFDYVASAMAIRNSFVKGMVCVFDFHRFADIIAGKYDILNDVWGNPILDIRDYDMILTESQFKLWKAFTSWEQYQDNCDKNGSHWGISKVTPKEEDKYCSTNYQFVQAINLNDSGIKDLCKTTVDWLNDITFENVYKTMLFLSPNSFKSDNFKINSVNNNIVKALILNNDIIKDPYVQKKVLNQLRTKIKKACMGKLLVEGNFQVMISDPYALCQYIFGLPVTGLLQRDEQYSHYWNSLNVDKVVGMRAPLTWRSEVNTLNLKKSEKMNEWFKYINSGIIYNVHGVDTMIAADSDYDFDIVMTTNSKEFIDNVYGGLPITYEKKPTLKRFIDEEELYLSDLYSFNSKIGAVTNYSTSMYCMLSEYEEESKEYKELIKRLKICRKEQGSQIDKAKGIIVKEFPKHWVNNQKISETETEEGIENKKFLNSLVINKKPYFMRWLYDGLNKEYKKYKSNADIYCNIKFSCSFDELCVKENKTDVEISYLDNYYKFSPVNEADCTMNKLAKYMETIKSDLIRNDTNFDYTCLMSKDFIVDQHDAIYKKITNIFNEYINDKQLFKQKELIDKPFTKQKFDESIFNNLSEMHKVYRNKLRDICSNTSQVANIVVDICYNKFNSKDKTFVWDVCIDWVLDNIAQKEAVIPIKDVSGDFEYLGEKYSLKEVVLVENIE